MLIGVYCETYCHLVTLGLAESIKMAYNYLITSVMISTFCLSFVLKKTKVLANGTAPICLRITIDGERIEFKTKRYILPPAGIFRRKR